jgi:hypothetical protein
MSKELLSNKIKELFLNKYNVELFQKNSFNLMALNNGEAPYSSIIKGMGVGFVPQPSKSKILVELYFTQTSAKSGSYINSIQELGKLFDKYKNDYDTNYSNFENGTHLLNYVEFPILEIDAACEFAFELCKSV